MKIRNGFVSNSSSSSFMIAYKGDLKEQLNKVFNLSLPDNFPIPAIANISKVFMDNVDTVYQSFSEYKDKCGYFEDEVIEGYYNNGFTVATGGFSDDYSKSLSSFLSNVDIDYESDSLIIYQDGGY